MFFSSLALQISDLRMLNKENNALNYRSGEAARSDQFVMHDGAIPPRKIVIDDMSVLKTI